MFNNVFNYQGIQLFVGLVGFCFDGLGSGAMWDQFEHICGASSRKPYNFGEQIYFSWKVMHLNSPWF